MKRILLFLSLILLSFILISCTNNESSLLDEMKIFYTGDDNINNVTKDITFTIDSSLEDAIVSWESDNDEVILISGNKGLVKRQNVDVSVTLTVNIIVDNQTLSKKFVLTVLKVVSDYYLITFDSFGGSNIDNITIEKGTTFSKPSDPTKDGYTFIGWFLNDVKFDFDTIITENITLVAKWEQALYEKEIYKFDFGTSRISGYDSQSFTFTNTDGSVYTLNKQRAQIYDSDNEPHKDQLAMLVLAPVNNNQIAYVEFDFNSVDNLSKIEFKFVGWNQTALNRLSAFNNAVFALQVLKDDNWVSVNDINNVNNLFDYITNSDLVYRWATFNNLESGKYRLFYNAPSAVSGNTSQSLVVDDMSVYGMFAVADGNVVTFDYNYEDAPTNYISLVESGSLVTEIDTPVRIGYDFVGWYIDDQEFNFDTPITTNITLKAKWLQSQIVVTFDFGLATLEPYMQLIDLNTKPLKIDDPQRDGYTFIGWYQTIINTPFNNIFDFNTLLNENVRLYAKWEINNITEHERNDNLLDEYYDPIKGLNDEDLVLGLRNIITNTHTNLTSYEEAKFILNKADKTLYDNDLVVGIYYRQSVNATWDSTSWHREHVWPNSKLGKTNVEANDRDQATDLHNLRAINPSTNSSRSNRYFTNSTFNSPIGHTIGSDAYYPGDEDIGDVARILMYMALRYDFLKLTNNQSLLILGDYTMETTFMGELNVLYNWHLKDPVDAFEISRNEVIYTNQGNRNPFIDQPELFEEVYEYFVEQDSINLSSKNMTLLNIEVTIYINYTEFINTKKYLKFI